VSNLFRKRQANEPGGRPVRQEVTLTNAEFNELTTRAANARMSVPRYLVASALQGGGVSADAGAGVYVEAGPTAVPRAMLTEAMKLQRMVALIGSNVNQVARVANFTNELPPETGAVIEAAHRIVRRLDEVLRAAVGK
jgi:hypothetical protein